MLLQLPIRATASFFGDRADERVRLSALDIELDLGRSDRRLSFDRMIEEQVLATADLCRLGRR